MRFSEARRRATIGPVLETLWKCTVAHGEIAIPFKVIAGKTGEDVRLVGEACRTLRALGLADYHSPLVDQDDGTPRGAGYAITPLGNQVAAALFRKPFKAAALESVE